MNNHGFKQSPLFDNDAFIDTYNIETAKEFQDTHKAVFDVELPIEMCEEIMSK